MKKSLITKTHPTKVARRCSLSTKHNQRHQQYVLESWLKRLDKAIEDKCKLSTARLVRRSSMNAGSYDPDHNIVLRLSSPPKRKSLKKPRRNSVLIRNLTQASQIASMIELRPGASCSTESFEHDSTASMESRFSSSLRIRRRASSMAEQAFEWKYLPTVC